MDQVIYTKDFYDLTTEKRAILELWWEVQVCHATLPLLICSLSGHLPVDTRIRWH